MSTATAADAAAPPKGKKKLVVIIAVVALVLAGGGGAAVMMMKKKAAEAELDGEGPPPAAKVAKHDPKAVPTFAPLEPFTVNLADRDTERFAQVGITLELEDAHVADQIKAYMPAIRNNILLAIADRTAADLQGREGKQLLAEKIRRETARALGMEVEDEEEAADEAVDKKPVKKKKKRAPQVLPVRSVHFSNFIIQ
jgi:flagellar protein FliL